MLSLHFLEFLISLREKSGGRANRNHEEPFFEQSHGLVLLFEAEHVEKVCRENNSVRTAKLILLKGNGL